jgi:probable rRNA maturation factor
MPSGEPSERPSGLEALVLNRQRRRRVSPQRLRGVLRGAARALGVSGEVALVLTGDRAVRPLNARYRGKDRTTDVLSFPGPCASHVGPRATAAGRKRHQQRCDGAGLGDIVISVEAAERNARGLGRSLGRELDVLALHGFLHVLGYDHETDDGTMDRLERRLRRRLLYRP